jgi:transcriptional regulator with XRE-family HTH domain
MNIIQGNNLKTLLDLAHSGARFDLIEIDGPYGAGLEDWDNLTEDGYLDHYTKRLSLVRQLLQPWGCVFFFGYPEGCAEIKAWSRHTETLYLRRWLTWYKQVTAHMGRKVETILFFLKGNPNADNLLEFGQFLKAERTRRGWTLAEVQRQAEALGAARPWWSRGCNLYYETGSAGPPSLDDLDLLSRIFQFNPDRWAHVTRGSYPGITDIDYISRTYPEDTDRLNDNGLRSKPVGLYMDLFRPCIPTTPERRALVLYGGSGNAGIAAEALGYDVTICEADPARAHLIERRAGKLIKRWTARACAWQPPLYRTAEQRPLFEG